MNLDRYTNTTGLSNGVLIVLGVVYLVIFIVMVAAYVNIIRRAGYSGWWILTALVPLLNVIMFLLFAFKQWPVQRELAALRQMAAGRGGPGPYGGGGPSGYYR